MSLGIDVSAFQKKIDWAKVKGAGIDFAILRGVIQSGKLDPYFIENYTSARAAGVEVKGVYHYSYALSEKSSEEAARNMISKLNGVHIPIYLDLEYTKQRSLGRAMITMIAIKYVQTCQSLGYECHIYSNLDWYKNHYDAKALRSLGCKFWIARYPASDKGLIAESLRPNVGENIWQYSSKGRIAGITGNVDLNQCFESDGQADGSSDQKTNPYEQPKTNVKSGSKGDTVKWAQSALNKNGEYDLNIDGLFGPKTRAAVIDYQRKNGLVVDGVVGVKTRQKLN